MPALTAEEKTQLQAARRVVSRLTNKAAGIVPAKKKKPAAKKPASGAAKKST